MQLPLGTARPKDAAARAVGSLHFDIAGVRKSRPPIQSVIIVVSTRHSHGVEIELYRHGFPVVDCAHTWQENKKR